jgi:glycosyltransferase involved in cell wall biosynthesis
MTRIIVATDAWHPQINGVVRTFEAVSKAARNFDAEIAFITPELFPCVPLPGYSEIRVGLPHPQRVERLMQEHQPEAVHIATEGPVGLAVRRYCIRNKMTFTTSFHTRFPEYLSARVPFPERWTWAWLRRFHAAAAKTLVATPRLGDELKSRGFDNIALWPRGVDTDLFRLQTGADLGLERPLFVSVGRVAVEKNLEAFLSLDLPGTKVIVGDGPARAKLTQQFPKAVFLGSVTGEALAAIYAAADVFVFPSRTDTFGLVVLEALACGIPVAAFPVAGPADVLGGSSVGVLDEDLRHAALAALTIPRHECRAFALRRNWSESARAFVSSMQRIDAPGRRAASGDVSTLPASLPKSLPLPELETVHRGMKNGLVAQ